MDFSIQVSDQIKDTAPSYGYFYICKIWKSKNHFEFGKRSLYQKKIVEEEYFNITRKNDIVLNNLIMCVCVMNVCVCDGILNEGTN